MMIWKGKRARRIGVILLILWTLGSVVNIYGPWYIGLLKSDSLLSLSLGTFLLILSMGGHAWIVLTDHPSIAMFFVGHTLMYLLLLATFIFVTRRIIALLVAGGIVLSTAVVLFLSR
jgi:hypothetical protein